MVYIEISLPIAFPDHHTTRQCLHIYELSEQIFENFPNSCFISSHLLEQDSYDNLLSSKCFEAKAI